MNDYTAHLRERADAAREWRASTRQRIPVDPDLDPQSIPLDELNVANPDSLIVHFNWDRHVAGAEFAQEYSSTLSADSIPALIQIVEDHPDEQFCFVERRLERERAALAAKRAAHGLLGDSWSQYRARGALSSFDVRSGDGC